MCVLLCPWPQPLGRGKNSLGWKKGVLEGSIVYLFYFFILFIYWYALTPGNRVGVVWLPPAEKTRYCRPKRKKKGFTNHVGEKLIEVLTFTANCGTNNSRRHFLGFRVRGWGWWEQTGQRGEPILWPRVETRCHGRLVPGDLWSELTPGEEECGCRIWYSTAGMSMSPLISASLLLHLFGLGHRARLAPAGRLNITDVTFRSWSKHSNVWNWSVHTLSDLQQCFWFFFLAKWPCWLILGIMGK